MEELSKAYPKTEEFLKAYPQIVEFLKAYPEKEELSDSPPVPVGCRFHPTDEELVNHYLRAKNNGDNGADSVIGEIDICKYEPSELPHMSLIKPKAKAKAKAKADAWFFFCPKVRKYQKGQRSNRATVKGYWKATGEDREVKSDDGTAVTGKKKTLVFHSGRARTGKRTDWVIHEYRATSEGSYVLCKLMEKHDPKRDQAEGKVDSPLAVESNTEDTKLEPVTRIPSAQGEKLPSSIDRDPVEHSDGSPQDAHQLEWRSSSSSVPHETGDEKIMPPDPELDEMLKELFSESVDEIFFVNAHMQTDLQASLGVRYSDPNNDTGHGHEGQDGPDGEYVNNFLNSILVSGEEFYGNCGNYLNESEGGFAHPECPCDLGGYGPIQQNIGRQPPVYMTVQQNISWATGQSVLTAPSAIAQLYENSPQESTNNNSTSVESETGIKIRSRPHSNRPAAQISESQGSAPRRVRLQVNLHGGSLRCPNFEAKQTVAKAGEAREELADTSATSSIVTQETTLSKSTTDAEEVAGGSSMNVKSGGCCPPGGDKGVSTARRKISSSAYLLRVLVTLGLAVALVGICYTFEF